MRDPSDGFVVLKSHDHGNNGQIVKSVEEGIEYFSKQLEHLEKRKLFFEELGNIDYLGYIEQGFEESKQFAGVKNFLVNREVIVEVDRIVSLFEPCKENGGVLGGFEEAFLVQINQNH